MNERGCPFCDPDPVRIFYKGDLVFGLWDCYPVTDGHALLIPHRHVRTWFDATEEEQDALIKAIDIAREEICREHNPDGFNIGINVDEAGGQTVFHLHVHVIPRYQGDVADPRGGVRYVIPSKANYTYKPKKGFATIAESAQVEPLVRGDPDDPLLPHLLEDIDRAVRADIAVAFVRNSGLDLVLEHFRDLLDRAGTLRFLTGDYLKITEPEALSSLLDLDGNLQLKVYESKKTSFHPKSYILHFSDDSGVAYVGSSNLTRTAMQDGVEWNYRVVTSADSYGFRSVVQAFESLFNHPSTCFVDDEWIANYRKRPRTQDVPVDVPDEPLEQPPKPHPIQQEALKALEKTREEGNSAGLVVLATGLGKTWLSAFDSNAPEYRRILFVAHREEILAQAMRTFRRIRPGARLGKYTGQEKAPDADILFASIQTLGRKHHLKQFSRESFDYIIVDEFHHAAARTYRNLIDFFEPRFLLGLTATPERTDGGDLLALCQENLVFRCDVFEGISRDLLSPFYYFGVPDEVNYENIPWRSSRFDEEALTQAVATNKRAQNALEQYREKAGKRTLAFCCSKRHADFMAEYFREKGMQVAAVHSGATTDPRAASLEKLEAGDLDVVFAVDMFNEGVDLPNVDTVMMLRPTESSILWIQQFGRGLRKAEGKDHLTVIDYIGNHRIFLTKPRTLFNLGPGDQEIAHTLKLLENGEVDLPPGCEVTYDLESVNILQSLLVTPPGPEVVRAYYQDFKERRGSRPTAVQTLHDGYNPRRTGFGSWVRFVKAMGDLTEHQDKVFQEAGHFLESLETTPMVKSYKMITLLAMLNNDALPGHLDITTLVASFAKISRRSSILRNDVSVSLENAVHLKRLLEENPINAWVGGKGMQGKQYFYYENEKFGTTFNILKDRREAFQELVREIVDWRLSEYLQRPDMLNSGKGEIICKVSHTGGRPILFLPDRNTHPEIPWGWQKVIADGTEYRAKFVKVAVNVMNRSDSDTNELPGLMRTWFGPDAGLPGTQFKVSFEKLEDGYKLYPLGQPTSGEEKVLWKQYAREEIPPQFGLEFKTSIWNAGLVVQEKDMFLLVTLVKGNAAQDYQYQDRFLSPDLFQWQSQNQTRQESKRGRMIRNHKKQEISVHLYVRKTKKLQSQSAPFVYCGEVDFIDWEGEKPITVKWRLKEPVPERLFDLLKVPGER